MKFEDFLKREQERPEFKTWWEEFGPGFEAGSLLIRIRFDLDLTQQQLADRAGVKRSYIARIENGAANPTVKSLARILGAVGLRLVLATEPRAKASEARARPARRKASQEAAVVAR
jgi:transcriptional regulator with XRE-family HTH domain